ncbi:translationally-controlled tumor protein [Streptomyces anulatus]
MIVYTDVITGDELFGDSFPVKEVDGIVFEVDSELATVQIARDVEISDLAAPNGQQDQGAPAGSTTATVNNVLHIYQLQPVSLDKAAYTRRLKSYMKKVKAHLETTDPGRVEGFEKQASAYAKTILARFGDFQFYTGSSGDDDGMVALHGYREDGDTAYFVFWKDGLKANSFQ